MNLKFISSIVAAAMALTTLTGTGIKGIDKHFSNANVAHADMLDFVETNAYYKPQGNFTYNTYYIAKWKSDINDPYQGCNYNTVYYVRNSDYVYHNGEIVIDARSCYNHYNPDTGHWRLEKISWYSAYYGGYRIIYSD